MEPIPSNYYDFFGLEHRLALDPRDLEKRFYSLSRKFHPDSTRSKVRKSSSMRSKPRPSETTLTGRCATR